MPKGEGNKIVAVPGSDQPYLDRPRQDVPDSPGLDPVTVDFELKRGVWIEGKITDKVTGKPLQGNVEYFALDSNPNLRDYPGFDGTIRPCSGVATKEDGSYRVVGLPGPGLVGRVLRTDHYLRAPERDDEFGIKEASLSRRPTPSRPPEQLQRPRPDRPGQGGRVGEAGRDARPGLDVHGHGARAGRQAPGRGAGLRPARSRRWDREAMKTAEFTVRGFNPRRPRDVLFQHPEKGLVGVAQPPKENGGSVTVRMEPGATVTGRLVDADGQPRAGVELEVSFRPKERPDWR